MTGSTINKQPVEGGHHEAVQQQAIQAQALQSAIPKPQAEVCAQVVEHQKVLADTHQTTDPALQVIQTNTLASEMDTFDVLAIIGLVTGILNLCVSWTFVGCFLGIMAIVCSVLGLKSQKYNKLAIIGFVLSIISTIAAIVITAITFALTSIM